MRAAGSRAQRASASPPGWGLRPAPSPRWRCFSRCSRSSSRAISSVDADALRRPGRLGRPGRPGHLGRPAFYLARRGRRAVRRAVARRFGDALRTRARRAVLLRDCFALRAGLREPRERVDAARFLAEAARFLTAALRAAGRRLAVLRAFFRDAAFAAPFRGEETAAGFAA